MSSVRGASQTRRFGFRPHAPPGVRPSPAPPARPDPHPHRLLVLTLPRTGHIPILFPGVRFAVEGGYDQRAWDQGPIAKAANRPQKPTAESRSFRSEAASRTVPTVAAASRSPGASGTCAATFPRASELSSDVHHWVYKNVFCGLYHSSNPPLYGLGRNPQKQPAAVETPPQARTAEHATSVRPRKSKNPNLYHANNCALSGPTW